MMSNEKLELLATIEELETELATANGLLDEIARIETGSDGESMAMAWGEVDHILAKRKAVE